MHYVGIRHRLRENIYYAWKIVTRARETTMWPMMTFPRRFRAKRSTCHDRSRGLGGLPCGLVYERERKRGENTRVPPPPKILPYSGSSSAKQPGRGNTSVLPCIIKLMLNERLRGGVISGQIVSRCIIPAVNSERLFIQGAKKATVGSRSLSSGHAIVPRRLLSLPLLFSLSPFHRRGGLGSRQVFELVPSCVIPRADI